MTKRALTNVGQGARLERALSSAGIGVWDAAAGQGLVWDDAASSLMGLDTGASPSLSLLKTIVSRKDLRRQIALIRRMRSAQGQSMDAPWQAEFRIRRPDTGDARWLRVEGRAEFSEQGAFVSLSGIVTDVTERRLEQKETARRERLYGSLVEAHGEMMCRFRLDGTLLFCNLAYANFFGGTRAWLESVNFWDRIDAETAEGLQDLLSELTPYDPERTVEHQLRRADGSMRWVEWTNTLIDIDAPGGGEFQSIGRDVTERRRIEEALRESEEKHRLLFETANVGLASIAIDGRIVSANPELCAMLGSAGPDIVGCDWRDFAMRDDLEGQGTDLSTFCSGDVDEIAFELRLLDRKGGARWVSVNGRRLRDETGRPLSHVAVIKDIDAQKRTETALAERSRTLELALEAAYAVAFVWKVKTDEVLRLHSVEPSLLANPQSPDRLSDIVAIVHPEDRGRFRANVEASLVSGSYRNEFRIRRMDGEVRWLEEWGHVEFDHRGKPERLVGISLDVTARKQGEALLRSSEERFRTIATMAQEGVWLIDPEGRTVFANRSMAGLLRLPEDGLVDRLLLDFCRPADLERVRAILESTFGGQPQTFELGMTRGDGTSCDVICSLAPMRNEQGEVTGAIGGFVDISERKAHEAHMRLVMRELSHRAKNLLAIILAIARQSSRGLTDFPAFERSFSDRIGALAQSHDLLVRENWQGAALDHLVQAQLGAFIGDLRARVSIEGPEILLSPNAVQYIGMALHELATNASKHGALSTAAGRIDIHWRQEGDVFRMDWIERDGPPVPPPSRGGFGRIVIEKMVSQALDGEATIDWRPEGLVWRLSAPLRNIAAAP